MKVEEILEVIRKRRRDEWKELYREKWINARIWVQENGEKAALIALLAGILIVLAFRLVISLLILAIILGAALYFLADSSSSVVTQGSETKKPCSCGHPDDDNDGPVV